MNTTTNTTRFNIFARSCNDDYSPEMEDLCVKMRLLSLGADPKMEVYDAKLEQSFYEEKDIDSEDNSRDEKNEETFGYNEDADYGSEAYEFNTRYGTCFSAEQLEIFKEYQKNTRLKTLDAIDYMQSCHKCGSFLEHFGNEYCNERCYEIIEDFYYPCFRGEDCLICYGYPETTCYWARKGCDKCDSYDGPEAERYPYSCTHCLTQMTDHEGYDVDYQLYCNNCAADLFDKTGHLENQDNDDQDNDDQDNDDQDSNDSKKRSRDPESDDEESDNKRQRINQEKSHSQMRDLAQESFDIWDLALDINNGDKEAALQMIEDQERLRAHPRIIEYYRAKNEECSSECSEQDYGLQKQKKAKHIRFESVDLDVSDGEEDPVNKNMVIDLLSQDDSECGNDYDADDYDYAESVVDYESDEEAVTDSVNMAQSTVSTMVTMIQELRDENAALRHELELLSGKRRMLFPEGSSISFTEEGNQRFIHIHHREADIRPLTMTDLECDFGQSIGGGAAMDIDDYEEEPLRLTRLTADSLPDNNNNIFGSYDDLQGSDIYPGGCSYNNRTTRR